MENIQVFIGSLDAFVQLVGCPSINPIFQQLVFGSFCTDLAKGLTWLYSTMLAITIFGLVVLSSRAALYSPAIRSGNLIDSHDCDTNNSNTSFDRALSQNDSLDAHSVIHSSTNMHSIVSGVISRFSCKISRRGYTIAPCIQSTNHVSIIEANNKSESTTISCPLSIEKSSGNENDTEEIEMHPIGTLL
jgi:hypothetical protein